MAITATCPGCSAIFRLPEELAGKSVRCQKCARLFVVPMLTVGDGVAMPEVASEMAPESQPELVEWMPEPVQVEPIVEPPPSEAAAPVAKEPERPLSRWWTVAAAGLFAVGFCATGAFAAIWVATHLAPPSSVVLVPPLKEIAFLAPPIREFPVFPKGRKDGKEFEFRNQPTQIDFDKDGRIQMQDRLLWSPAGGLVRANGRPVNLVTHRRYRLKLEGGQRYNFFVRAKAFNPRIYIQRVNAQVAENELNADNRTFLSYRPNVDDDYTIVVTSEPAQVGDFFLSIAVEREEQPKLVDLRKQPSASFQETLQVQDAREPNGNPSFGPYHEYRVTLDAHTDYVFKVNERNNNPSFLPVLQIRNNTWQTYVADQQTRRMDLPFRVAKPGEYRIRLTSRDYGEGAYTLTLERKDAVKRLDNSKRFAPYLVHWDENGRYEETHVLNERDPLDPAKLGRGPYKEYIVTLTKGQNYRIELTSKRFPPMVALYDGQNLLAHSRGAAAASIDFNPKQTATYRIRAIATHPFDRGQYSIKIALR